MFTLSERQRRRLRAGGAVEVGGVIIERGRGGWCCAALVTGGGVDDPGHPFYERRLFVDYDLIDVVPLFVAHLADKSLTLVEG